MNSKNENSYEPRPYIPLTKQGLRMLGKDIKIKPPQSNGERIEPIGAPRRGGKPKSKRSRFVDWDKHDSRVERPEW